jgi:hypothetical protein
MSRVAEIAGRMAVDLITEVGSLGITMKIVVPISE